MQPMLPIWQRLLLTIAAMLASELDCRAVVEFPLQLPATKFSWGHDRRIGRAAVLGITERVRPKQDA
jgi:hypothetical protein